MSGADQKLYAAASPITHVSPSAPPSLLLHGDADDMIPFQQSVALETALRAASVPVKLLRVPGGRHGPDFRSDGKPHPEVADARAEMIAWMKAHLAPAR